MELDEVIRRRRMYRRFSPDPVAPEVVDRILDRARRSPSAGHTQGWAFLVLEGAEKEQFWQLDSDASWRSSEQGRGLMAASTVILPLVSESAYRARYSEADKDAARVVGGPDHWQAPYWLVDGSFATMLLLLGVTAEGLGALFFALHGPQRQTLSAFGVPPEWTALGAIALGWPQQQAEAAGDSARRGRRPFSEVVHRGRW